METFLGITVVIILIGALVAIIGTISMSLWNWLMPMLFNLPEITF